MDENSILKSDNLNDTITGFDVDFDFLDRLETSYLNSSNINSIKSFKDNQIPAYPDFMSSNTNNFKSVGFTTGSGNSLPPPSKKAILAARTLLGDIDDHVVDLPTTSAQIGRSNSINSNENLPPFENSSMTKDDTHEVNSVTKFGGFSLASGKTLKPVSELAMQAAKMMFNDIDTTEPNIITNVEKIPFQVENNSDKLQNNIPISVGFGTASGKKLKPVSNDALKRAQQLLDSVEASIDNISPNTIDSTIVHKSIDKVDSNNQNSKSKLFSLSGKTHLLESSSSTTSTSSASSFSSSTTSSVNISLNKVGLRNWGNNSPFKSPLKNIPKRKAMEQSSLRVETDISKSTIIKSKFPKISREFDELTNRLKAEIPSDIIEHLTELVNNEDVPEIPININKRDNIMVGLNHKPIVPNKSYTKPLNSVKDQKSAPAFDLQSLTKRISLKSFGIPFNGTKEDILSFLSGKPPVKYLNMKTHPIFLLLRYDAESINLVKDCLQVNTRNCETYVFNAVSKDASLLESQDNYFEKVKGIFLATKNVNEILISKEWVQNHYGLIVWKFAILIRRYPGKIHPKLFNFDTLLDELSYRYELEVNQAKRSCLKLIYEFDDTPAKPMILCVYDIIHNSDDSSADFKLILSDGWYKINCVVDHHIQSLVRRNKITIGSKLYIVGAKLCGITEPISPLDSNCDSAYLAINVNSIRRALWYKPLGFALNGTSKSSSKESDLTFVPQGLHQIVKGGGIIPAIKIIVLRKYGIFYKELNKDGDMIKLTKTEDEILQNKWQIKHEFIYNRLLKDHPLDFSDYPNNKPTETDIMKHNMFIQSLLDDEHPSRDRKAVLPIRVCDYPVVKQKPHLVRSSLILIEVSEKGGMNDGNDLFDLFKEGSSLICTRMKVAYANTEFRTYHINGANNLMHLVPTKETSYIPYNDSKDVDTTSFLSENGYFMRIKLPTFSKTLSELPIYLDAGLKIPEFDLSFVIITVLNEDGSEFIYDRGTAFNTKKDDVDDYQKIVKIIGADMSQLMIMVEIPIHIFLNILQKKYTSYKKKRHSLPIINNNITRKLGAGVINNLNIDNYETMNKVFKAPLLEDCVPTSALKSLDSNSMKEEVGISMPTQETLENDHFVISMSNLEYSRKDSDLGLYTLVVTDLTTWSLGIKTACDIENPIKFSLEQWVEENLILLHELKYGFKLREYLSIESLPSV